MVEEEIGGIGSIDARLPSLWFRDLYLECLDVVNGSSSSLTLFWRVLNYSYFFFFYNSFCII
jgi:hypothetical protein